MCMFCDATSFQICEPLACLQKTNAHGGALEHVNMKSCSRRRRKNGKDPLLLF